MFKRKCESCGTEHWIKPRRVLLKKTGMKACHHCGTVLIRWTKSTTVYDVKTVTE